MTPEEIGAAYDQITQLWDDATFDRSNGLEQHRRALRFAATKGKALDVGCGATGRFIDLLREAGYVPEGIDVSAGMVELARARHPEVVFHHGDVGAFPALSDYDFITAWDSLWHLPTTEQRRVLSLLFRALRPGGVIIFSFGGTDTEDTHQNSAMGPMLSYASLGVSGVLETCAAAGLVCRHLEYDDYPELHAYCVAQRPLS